MLLYSYPLQMSINEKRLFKINAKISNKKYKKSFLKSIFISLIIIFVSFLTDSLLGKLLLIGVALINFFLALFVFMQSYININSKSCLKIYDEKIVNVEFFSLTKSYKRYTINFEDIMLSNQDLIGNLVIYFKKTGFNYSLIYKDGSVNDKKSNKNKIVLHFYSTEPKFYLINNFADKIKYVSKGYKGADYSDDDKDKWE